MLLAVIVLWLLDKCVFYMRKDFNYQCHLNVEKFYRMPKYFYISSKQFSTLWVIQCCLMMPYIVIDLGQLWLRWWHQSHYLIQGVLWNSPESNIARGAHVLLCKWRQCVNELKFLFQGELSSAVSSNNGSSKKPPNGWLCWQLNESPSWSAGASQRARNLTHQLFIATGWLQNMGACQWLSAKL